MKKVSFPITLLLAAVSFGAHAAPEFLPLDANVMQAMEFESIPPFPAERLDGYLGYAGQVSRDDCDRDRRLTSSRVLR
jgi:hypothetical protein